MWPSRHCSVSVWSNTCKFDANSFTPYSIHIKECVQDMCAQVWYDILLLQGVMLYSTFTQLSMQCVVSAWPNTWKFWCEIFSTSLYLYQKVCSRYVCSSLIWYPPATGGNGVKPLFQLYQTKYLEIWCKIFCILLYLYQRVCLRHVYSSLIWYPPATGGNLVKQLFQLYQTQYLDILCKLFWTMECACRDTCW